MGSMNSTGSHCNGVQCMVLYVLTKHTERSNDAKNKNENTISMHLAKKMNKFVSWLFVWLLLCFSLVRLISVLVTAVWLFGFFVHRAWILCWANKLSNVVPQRYAAWYYFHVYAAFMGLKLQCIFQMRSLYRNGTAILTLVLVSSSSLSQSLCVCVCVSVEREIVINFARCNIPECIHFDWYWFISENWIVLIVKIVVVVVVFFGRSDCLCSCCYCCCSNVFCTLEQYLVDTVSDFHSTELRTKKSHTRSVR